MSEIISKYVNCPKCEQRSMIDFVCSVNTEEQPKTREAIFNESFFRWKCVKCGFSVERSQIVDEKLEQEFEELNDIKKRVVPSINAMKEKITLFEGGYNDLAVELSKLAVAEVVAKSTGQNVYEGYCTAVDKSENSITFQFFLGGGRHSYIQTTRYDVYHRSLGIVKEYFSGVDSKKGFLNINQAWAQEALKRYKNSD